MLVELTCYIGANSLAAQYLHLCTCE